ncbi:hypothetical protein SESBI_11272 [Sesbania bispinosa]|nr:hypothetical protein SESBI_11272 [Sesbania bispinosa]
MHYQEWATFFRGWFPNSVRESFDNPSNWKLQKWTGFPEYTCIVFHPEEFGLQFGFEPFKFTGRLLSITFIEGTVQDEVRKVKLRNARLMKELKEAKQQLRVFQTVHSVERSSSPRVERRRSL